MDARYKDTIDWKFTAAAPTFCQWKFYFIFPLLTLALACQVTAADIGKDKPQTFYVAVEQARLYSGPSLEYYPTGTLKRGLAIEVYQHTKNGWLGVRPPEGSFSWVPASQAYLLPGGRVIEITDAEAVSWIGTDLGSAKQYRWQVQLKVGEQLTVLSESSIKSGKDNELESLWYRVAPPAGEFRWIERSAVAENPIEPSAINGDRAPNRQAVTDKQVQNNEIQSASYSEAVATPDRTGNSIVSSNQSDAVSNGAQTSKTNSGKLTGSKPIKQNSNPKQLPQRSANSWDGWHAFEMGSNGMRTPLLDKMSGRDPGPSAQPSSPNRKSPDPLAHDPFSLTMAGEPSKPIPENLSATIASKTKRAWRDPQSLRESRISDDHGPNRERFARAEATDSTIDSSYVTTTSDRSLAQNIAGVGTASFEASREPQAEPATNWYGIGANNQAKQTTTAPARVPNGEVAALSIAELQVALNEMVSQPPTMWNLASLTDRTLFLTEHAPTAIDRGHARLLLERIEAFQSIAHRSGQLPNNAPVQPAGFTAPVPEPPSVQASRNSSGAINSSINNYDATGWLVPVHASTTDQPSHAITNDAGDIIAYVSGIPGLNLDRYKNQAVGITGLRGYLPQLRAPHIQAQRVSAIK